MLLSSPLLYSVLPSGDTDMVRTPPVCPSRTETISACARHRQRVAQVVPRWYHNCMHALWDSVPAKDSPR